MDKEIDKKIKIILIRFAKFNITENEIDDNTDIVEDLHLDSLSLIEFITELEIEFDIEFNSEEFEDLFKYKDLLSLVETKIA